MTIAARLASVLEEIRRAEAKANRAPGSVRLVAVSKTHPASAIREAYEAGQRDFGENYVQELEEKARELADLDGIRWHFIGHLQTNKAKVIARIAHVVHTIDSAKLAKELGKRAAAESKKLPVLVEVNVGGEAQKSGCAPGDLASVIESIRAEASLELRGLMTVPPHTDDPEGARPFFRALRELRERHDGALPELSMGMTHDVEIAIAEGATMVRIGTAIFGPRT